MLCVGHLSAGVEGSIPCVAVLYVVCWSPERWC